MQYYVLKKDKIVDDNNMIYNNNKEEDDNNNEEEEGMQYDCKTRMCKICISKNDEFDITFNASSMHFLSDHRLSIDKWSHESALFCTSREHATMHNKFQNRMKRLNKNSNNMMPTRKEDIDF